LLYRDAQGREVGIDADVIQALAEHSGCTLDAQVISRNGVAAGMARGSVALSPSTIASAERAALGELWPYARSPMVVLLPRDQAQRWPQREAFDRDPTLRLVTVRGHRHGEDLDAWVQALRAQGRTTEVGDVPAALRALRTGRAQAFISVAVAVGPDMDDLAAMDWDRSGGVVGHLWVGHHVPEAERERLRLALQAMLADGTVDRIFQRHLGATLARRTRLGRSARGA
jgi:polar amino acid transport system substrate-binding protein